MKKTQRTRIAFLISLVSLPTVVFADMTTGLGTLNSLVSTFTTGVVSSLAALFATMAMVAFFWGIVQFVWGSREGKSEVMTNGKNFMLWGLIALFVMFSVWGIITYVQNIFGISGNTITIPRIEITPSSSGSGASNTGLPSGGSAVVGANCTSNAECGTGLTCRNFTCQQPAASGGSSAVVGADCTSNAECGTGLTCQNYTCQQ